MPGPGVIPGIVNTIIKPFDPGRESQLHPPAGRSLHRLLNIVPALLPLQTQNVSFLPYKPGLGPIIDKPGLQPPSAQAPAPQQSIPYYQGGGSFDPWSYQPTFNPYTQGGFSPWASSTISPAPSTPQYQASAGYSAGGDRTWEDLTSVASEVLPFFL